VQSPLTMAGETKLWENSPKRLATEK